MKWFLPAIAILISTNLQAQSFGNWTYRHTLGFRQMNGAQMLDNNTFVLVGGREYNDSIQSVTTSSDGGNTLVSRQDLPHYPWLTSTTFLNSSTGYATGYAGAFLKTLDRGVTWTDMSLTGNLAGRQYNGIYFFDVQNGFIAGGNRSNDSLQTILKTTDGGQSWVPQRDTFGPWLKDIYFINPQTGFAVGELGTLLKTTNGGSSWSKLNLTGNIVNRTFNSIWFADSNTGIIVGGQKTNDSIQTILQTTDGGNTWNIISDNIAPCLNAVQFYDANNAYAVGDWGTILSSNNKGTTWTSVILPDSVNDNTSLYGVNFLNQYFGVATGAFGKTLSFHTDTVPVPTLQTLSVVFSAQNTVQLTGFVNLNAATTANIYFEYGTSLSNLVAVPSTPPTASGAQNTTVTTAINYLIPNTWYYYRLKSSGVYGINYSGTDSFKTSPVIGEIPNWNFELWDSTTKEVLNNWACMGVGERVPSFDGGNALHLFSYNDGLEYHLSAAVTGQLGGGSLSGGKPFTARPDSMIAYIKYDVAAGDSAGVLAFFKSAGNSIGNNLFYISGSSGGNFERFAFPLSYSTGDTPDSILVGFSNTMPFAIRPANPYSTVTVDKVSFSGTSQNIPNADFENWTSDTIFRPLNWPTIGAPIMGDGFASGIKRSTDKYSGQFALELANDPEFQDIGIVVFAQKASRELLPAFALNHSPISLNGYFKYYPGGNDTLTIQANLFRNDSIIAFGNFTFFDSTGQYTPFSILLNPYSNMIIPDSAAIVVYSSGTYARPTHGKTRLLLDDLSYDGFLAGSYVDTVAIINGVHDIEDGKVVLYPNPASSVLYLSLNGFADEKLELVTTDLKGSTIEQRELNGAEQIISLDLSTYQPGFYILSLRDKDKLVSKKFLRIK